VQSQPPAGRGAALAGGPCEGSGAKAADRHRVRRGAGGSDQLAIAVSVDAASDHGASAHAYCHSSIDAGSVVSAGGAAITSPRVIAERPTPIAGTVTAAVAAASALSVRHAVRQRAVSASVRRSSGHAAAVRAAHVVAAAI